MTRGRHDGLTAPHSHRPGFYLERLASVERISITASTPTKATRVLCASMARVGPAHVTSRAPASCGVPASAGDMDLFAS
jgi:hypothetical protein